MKQDPKFARIGSYWFEIVRKQIRRVYSVGSNVANSIRFALFVGSDFFDSIGRIVECQIFDIRSTLLRMSDFRHSISRSPNVEYSTSEAPFFGCRIFDIRSAVRRMSNIGHPKRLNSDIEHSMSARCSLQLLTRHQTIYIQFRLFSFKCTKFNFYNLVYNFIVLKKLLIKLCSAGFSLLWYRVLLWKVYSNFQN